MIFLVGKGERNPYGKNIAIGVCEKFNAMDKYKEKYFLYAIKNFEKVQLIDDKIEFRAGDGYHICWISNKKIFHKLVEKLEQKV